MTETSHPRVRIGEHEIQVSPKHIYLSKNLPATYDYLPWNLIGRILEESGLEDYCLLDIGANVGDSLAHFRRVSAKPAICVEPSANFFPLLERNAAAMAPVELVQALVVPRGLSGQVVFCEDEQTGSSRAGNTQDDEAWTGAETSFEELLAHGHGATVLKTDTDGFDAELLHGLLDMPGFDPARIPLIFFEGPAREHLCSDHAARWIDVLARLQARGYGLLFVTNRGIPLAYAGTCAVTSRSLMNALRSGMSNGFAICHYFDIIAVHETLPARVHRFSSPLDAADIDLGSR